MKISAQSRDNHIVMKVEGSLSNENMHQFDEALTHAIVQGRHVLLDLSDLNFINSSGLGLIIAKNNRAKSENLSLVLYGMSGEMSKLFTVTDLHKHLNIVETYDEACAFLDGTH